MYSRRPQHQPNEKNRCNGTHGNFPRITAGLHLLKANPESSPDRKYLERREELPDIFDTGRQPRVEDTTLVSRIEECSMQRRHQTENGSDQRTSNGYVCERRFEWH